MKRPKLYLEISTSYFSNKIFDITEGDAYGSLETLIVVFLAKYCDYTNADIVFVERGLADHLVYPLQNIGPISGVAYSDIPESVRNCRFPVVEVYSQPELPTVITGLCAVLRWILNDLEPNHPDRHLLGFRGGCLRACAESSVWTKFCEVELPDVLRSEISNKGECRLSEQLLRFEHHLALPVRAHNLGKRACELEKKLNGVTPLESQNIVNGISNMSLTDEHLPVIFKGPNKDGNVHLPLVYAEGFDFLMSDLILYCCYTVIFQLYAEKLSDILPLTLKWFQKVGSFAKVDSLSKTILPNAIKIYRDHAIAVPNEVSKVSLYKRDPNRFKPHRQQYTKQDDIDSALKCLVNSGLFSWEQNSESIQIVVSKQLTLNVRLHDYDDFLWNTLPEAVHPEGGGLPKKRLQKKCQQLENMAVEVLKMCQDGDHVVDFCSGGGHLGLLVAYLAPKCRVSLVENKVESLTRAVERAAKLQLRNVTFYQGNLDNFHGKFDVGMSLHACGTATDLVLQKCIESMAKFACCPCCYGSVQDNHIITYPRSSAFKRANLAYGDYLVVGHSADQTHDSENAKTSQGKLCMSLIDCDRSLQAVEQGYDVTCCVMKPETCSPKNHLLIGVPRTLGKNEV